MNATKSSFISSGGKLLPLDSSNELSTFNIDYLVHGFDKNKGGKIELKNYYSIINLNLILNYIKNFLN